MGLVFCWYDIRLWCVVRLELIGFLSPMSWARERENEGGMSGHIGTYSNFSSVEGITHQQVG